MALIIPVAGPYTSAHTPGASASGSGTSAVSMGILSDDGFSLRWVIHKQKIGPDGTDRFGLARLENVIRGGDWNLIFRCREYASGNLNVAWPYGRVSLTLSPGGNANFAPVMAQAGCTDDGSGFTGSLVLTAIAGTPAALNPATLTAAKVVNADANQGDMMFTSKAREVPVNLELLPYSQTYGTSPSQATYVNWFSTT
jgi:hypothetical protein